jgi:predicted regulator of Ras-like GTPase activity (Roadblock/LC7/MglB family)
MTMFSALSEDASQKIDQVLRELLEQVEAEAVYFCDRGGNIIASQSVSPQGNEENIAALAAGSFFATLTMAKLVGETEFQNMLHQGEKTSIYMEGLKGDMILVVIFNKDSNPGLVKLYAKTACQQLEPFKLSLVYDEKQMRTIPHMEIDENAQAFTPTKPPGKS